MAIFYLNQSCRKILKFGLLKDMTLLSIFSNFQDGDQIYLVNHLEMKDDGTGPTGRDNANGDFIMRFDVVPAKGPDLSKIPDKLRELPPIDMSLVRKDAFLCLIITMDFGL